MYRRMLLTLDLGPVDRPAIEHVRWLAKACEAAVTVTHVVRSETRDGLAVEGARAREYLQEVAVDLGGSGLVVEPKLLSGDPAAALSTEVATGGYDLVVMGTHGHRGLMDLLLGSVSDQLRHRVTVPVLLVPGRVAGPAGG